MANTFGMRCPKCGSTDRIDVLASVWVRLVADGTDADGSHDGSHEWTDDSPAVCNACDYRGRAIEFDPNRD